MRPGALDGIGCTPLIKLARLPGPDDADVFDRVESVSTADAFAMARRAATTEGVWTGPSGGANIVAALRLARSLGSGHRVVTVQPDSGLKYLAGDLFGTAMSAVTSSGY